ncbi:B-box zinc finger protein 20-like isoform X2 [Phragmites australis]|uniref:B-box zinc finger protein 20-like isoform X2 n=1 Tax=Phragmites australis TaxID=29695 RepID=UPI002D7699EC|nr:B-box zinc finger protein 20-like isoform X2 [Phragmites australis]
MKVQCDVCAAEAASVFCCADEAALCDACDRRVHRANKLAGKHRRLSLLNPSPSSSASAQQLPPPLCDICQEKRGLLFCKEDRAILCQDCDVSVHTASELTMRHTRFLLTGVRLSAEPAACPAPPSEDENSSSSSFCCTARDAAPPAPATSHGSDSSSISEYLTKTLPGWHVEDFLVDEATTAAAAAAAAASATAIGISADASYQEGLTRTGGLQDGYTAWMAQERLFCESAVAGDARASRERWVPQVYTELAGGKRSRATSGASYSYW